MELIALLLFFCVVIFVTVVSLILNLIWFAVAFCIWVIRIVISLVFMILLLPFMLLGLVKSSAMQGSVFTQKPTWIEPRFKFKQERFRNSRGFAFDSSQKERQNHSSRRPETFKDATFEDVKEQHDQGQK